MSTTRDRIDSMFEADVPEAPGPHPFDTVGFVMAYEDGGLSEEEIVEGFQHLIDNGTVWQLQGMYGRTAADLIEQGLCTDTHKVLKNHPRFKNRPEYQEPQ